MKALIYKIPPHLPLPKGGKYPTLGKRDLPVGQAGGDFVWRYNFLWSLKAPMKGVTCL